jgi:hypothetical protein
MARYTIMHIFEVPARDEYEATDQLMAAREAHQDKKFLVKLIVRQHGDNNKTVIDMRPPASWLLLLKTQLLGK